MNAKWPMYALTGNPKWQTCGAYVSYLLANVVTNVWLICKI